MITAVIMAGGSGTRLWPLSRAAYPKQFIALHGEETMLQSTINRLSGFDINEMVIICNESHRFIVAEQLRKDDASGSIILEPFGRNTAPAIALAALKVKDDPLLLILAADHVVGNQNAFDRAITEAIPLAESGKLVTFGIVPTAAHTGYGYVKRGQKEGASYTVESFVEKPSIENANNYVESGMYYWNSGMFLFKASKYIEELKKYRLDIFEACVSAMDDSTNDLDFVRVDVEAFRSCPSDSVDYAVMENTADAVVVPMDADWSDLGSWSSLWDISKKDHNGNSVNGDVMLHCSNNCYIQTDDKLVSAIGVNDLVIVNTKDAVMIAHKDNVDDVKIIAAQLKASGRSEWNNHREVFRPWGSYDSISCGEGYQVKRITVNPGAKLSVQMHYHRAEHWVVVSGTARVINGDKTFILSKNESTYIPIGVTHSLQNPGKVPLEIIEVQSGSYLGEDDIVRFEDIYGRVESSV